MSKHQMSVSKEFLDQVAECEFKLRKLAPKFSHQKSRGQLIEANSNLRDLLNDHGYQRVGAGKFVFKESTEWTRHEKK